MWLSSFGLAITLIQVYLSPVHAQLPTIFGYTDRPTKARGGCDEWSAWGQCTWIRGSAAWDKGHLDQVPDECQKTDFYRQAKKDYGDAIDNVMNHFRKLIVNRRPCGYCAFQQSCQASKSECSSKSDRVAERLCAYTRQSQVCTISPLYSPKDCKVWPDKSVELPNVSGLIRRIVDSTPFMHCVPGESSLGAHICLCCCHPYKPDSRGRECIEPK